MIHSFTTLGLLTNLSILFLLLLVQKMRAAIFFGVCCASRGWRSVANLAATLPGLQTALVRQHPSNMLDSSMVGDKYVVSKIPIV